MQIVARATLPNSECRFPQELGHLAERRSLPRGVGLSSASLLRDDLPMRRAVRRSKSSCRHFRHADGLQRSLQSRQAVPCPVEMARGRQMKPVWY